MAGVIGAYFDVPAFNSSISVKFLAFHSSTFDTPHFGQRNASAQPAILNLDGNPVIAAGMPESSAKDGKLPVGQALVQA